MGQAFDPNGNVLGEAFGNTKSEVFEKLNAQFKDAAEIRIRSFHRSGDSAAHLGAGASAEMPKYRSHKEVWALKIAEVRDPSADTGNESNGTRVLVPEDARYAAFGVDAAFVRKHGPFSGGYYVVYADGYTSFSPAQAFEEGYTRLP